MNGSGARISFFGRNCTDGSEEQIALIVDIICFRKNRIVTRNLHIQKLLDGRIAKCTARQFRNVLMYMIIGTNFPSYNSIETNVPINDLVTDASPC